MLPLLLQLATAPAPPAVTATASVQVLAASGDHWYRDRELVGVRYRPHLFGRFWGNLGGSLSAENGLFPSKSGATTRHWAVGLEGTVISQDGATLRFGVIHGRLVSDRTTERVRADGLPLITYYAFVAVSADLYVTGLEGPAGPWLELGIEHPVYVPQSVGLATNDAIVRWRTRPVAVMLRKLINARNQQPYEFWTMALSVQPFEFGGLREGRIGKRLRWLTIEGGSRPVPSYSDSRAVALRYVGVGATVTTGR